MAQGIGITPFVSLLRDRRHRGLPLSARLYHSNLAAGIPFGDELQALAAQTELDLTYLTEPVTPDYLIANIPELQHSTVYVSGPGSLIKLLAPPVNLPAARLKQDFFPNYGHGEY